MLQMLQNVSMLQTDKLCYKMLQMLQYVTQCYHMLHHVTLCYKCYSPRGGLSGTAWAATSWPPGACTGSW